MEDYMRIVKLTDETKNNILEDLLKRSPNSYGKFEAAVNDILLNVRTNKDEALFKYTKDFDKADIDASNIVVTKDEIEEAYTKVDPALVDVIRKSLKNIKEYHEKQKQYSWFDSKPDGTILGQKVTPLARAGVYVPGGKAAYPSSVLMNVVPAKVAGVEQIIMCTPPDHEGKCSPLRLHRKVHRAAGRADQHPGDRLRPLGRRADGAESGGHGLHGGSLWTGLQGYVPAHQGADETGVGTAHFPRRASCPPLDDGQHFHPHRPGRQHQAGQREIHRENRRRCGDHYGT